jgi:hypothetical protein
MSSEWMAATPFTAWLPSKHTQIHVKHLISPTKNISRICGVGCCRLGSDPSFETYRLKSEIRKFSLLKNGGPNESC